MLLHNAGRAVVQGWWSRSALSEGLELNGELGGSGGPLAGDHRMIEFGRDLLIQSNTTPLCSSGAIQSQLPRSMSR